MMARKAKQVAVPEQTVLPVVDDKSNKTDNNDKSKIWNGPGNLVNKGRIIRPGDEISED